MPDLDGITAIKSLRKQGFSNPIIVLTGSESEEDRKRAYDAGCNNFIVKSMEMRDLEPAIDLCLQKGGGL
jgi:two-component system response regulator QseB